MAFGFLVCTSRPLCLHPYGRGKPDPEVSFQGKDTSAALLFQLMMVATTETYEAELFGLVDNLFSSATSSSSRKLRSSTFLCFRVTSGRSWTP